MSDIPETNAGVLLEVTGLSSVGDRDWETDCVAAARVLDDRPELEQRLTYFRHDYRATDVGHGPMPWHDYLPNALRPALRDRFDLGECRAAVERRSD